jgi:hypothetical protein
MLLKILILFLKHSKVKSDKKFSEDIIAYFDLDKR